MKRKLFFLQLILAIATLNGQSHFDIDFTGANGVMPQTIEVANLTKGSGVTLQGNDILRLNHSPSSLQQIEFTKSKLSVFPNPIDQNGYFKFTNPSPALVQIHLHSYDGKLLHHNSFELPQGDQLFKISGVPAGEYVISITTAEGVLSGRISSSMKPDTHVSTTLVGNVALHHQNNSAMVAGRSKALSTFIVEMSYSPGDKLRFLGSAAGHVSQTIYASPTGNQTLAFFLTQLVEVINPATGIIWMDRNLGAMQVATSSDDADAYGDLYQWGRGADGHEKRTSQTISTLSSNDTPVHGLFITPGSVPYDWRSPQNNNLWQGVNGVNNPCPAGFRIPTLAEWNAERASWSSKSTAGAFASPLKLPVAGIRNLTLGSLFSVGSGGRYWSCTVNGSNAQYLFFSNGDASMYSSFHASGFSVRCIKDVPVVLPTVTTASVTNISSSTASAGGNVTANGGASVTERGVVWSTSQNPSVSLNTKTSNGTGVGSFTSWLSGLLPGTTYYVRAYATNSEGTAYGPELSFTTTAAFTFSTVTSATGRIWIDRDLGANRIATSSTDAQSYGDFYQWGRGADGHEKRTSQTISTLSSSDTPGHDMFITINSGNYDWRSPQNNNLWQGVNGTNNPCPAGFRIPTSAEWDAERASWSSNNSAGAFASALKLPVAGLRYYTTGLHSPVGSGGYYWSGTVSGAYAQHLYISSGNAYMLSSYRANGLSVRCIKE